MRQRRLSVEEVRRLGALLSDGLAAAHRTALSTATWRRTILCYAVVISIAFIIDFGIAKRIDGSSSTLIGSAFAGKLDYCSL